MALTRKQKRDLYNQISEARSNSRKNAVKDIRLAGSITEAIEIYDLSFDEQVQFAKDERAEIIRLRKL